MLKLKNLDTFHGASQVLRDFTIEVNSGEVLCLLGRNGAGKTTALRTIMGLIRARSGSITFEGRELGGLPGHEIPRLGIGYVPQGRRLFSELTVRENLEIGLMCRGSGRHVFEAALDCFPRLRERLDQVSGTLSGGEQQMLAIGRALCVEPSIMLLDEPTEGLQPSMISTIRDVLLQLRANGVGILLVEQRIDAVLPVADRVAFIENGRVRDTVGVRALTDRPELLKKYVGVG